jgi:hypothetical protein
MRLKETSEHSSVTDPRQKVASSRRDNKTLSAACFRREIFDFLINKVPASDKSTSKLLITFKTTPKVAA